MGRLIYLIISSLDGYIADESGSFDWAMPDEEVLAFLNHQEESVGTYLYGRRMYELMHVWENDPAAAAQSPESANFARVWQAAGKIVYSTTLPEVWTRKTELRRDFDADEVRQLKVQARADINIAGPDLAAHAFRAGLVDEIQVMIAPVIIGSGKAYYARSKVPLVLREERRFGNGMMWLRYDVA